MYKKLLRKKYLRTVNKASLKETIERLHCRLSKQENADYKLIKRESNGGKHSTAF